MVYLLNTSDFFVKYGVFNVIIQFYLFGKTKSIYSVKNLVQNKNIFFATGTNWTPQKGMVETFLMESDSAFEISSTIIALLR